MPEPSLPEKVVALERTFDDEVPHAFGGALALAYYAPPRATDDIDINVFVHPDAAEVVFERLSTLGVIVDADARSTLARDGQCRVWWGRTPVDLFFADHALHAAMARRRRRVPFADTEIAILAPEHLVVCKALFNRSQDWVDIEQMLAGGVLLRTAEVQRWMGSLAGAHDGRTRRLAQMLAPAVHRPMPEL